MRYWVMRCASFVACVLAALSHVPAAHAQPGPGAAPTPPAAPSGEASGVYPDAPPADAPGATPAATAETPELETASDEEAPFEEEDLLADDDFSFDASFDDGPKLKLTWNARVQSDIRFRTHDVGVGSWWNRAELPAGIDRNENLLGLSATAAYGRVSAKADIDFILYGYARDVATFGDLHQRERVDPYRFDVHNLYIEVRDLFVRGLDMRVGQQIVNWGVADQFNPTNNLNADNVEDVLLFGKQQGNLMVRLDYWLDEDWSHQLVVVPAFKPALLPRSASLALGAIDRLPITDDALRWRLHSETAAALDNPLLSRNATVVSGSHVEVPDLAIENVQLGYRIAGTVFEQDISLSYYLGRHDFPVPYKNVTRQEMGAICNPDDAGDCLDSLLKTDVYFHYPRMHVYGFNMAGEVGWLQKISEAFNAVGYRIEAALVVPERTTFEVYRGAVDLGGVIEVPAGEYDYDGDGIAGGARPTVIDATPFAKWTVGLDYTFGRHVYANVQWVHGMPDEFGAGDFITEGYTVAAGGVTSDPETTAFRCAADLSGTEIRPGKGDLCAREMLRPRLGDYLVTGIDVRLLDQKLLLRLFTILALNGVKESRWDPSQNRRVMIDHSMFTPEGFSAVVYPEVNYNFGNGLDIGAGVLAQLGQAHTKFGDAAAGGTIVWLRPRFSF